MTKAKNKTAPKPPTGNPGHGHGRGGRKFLPKYLEEFCQHIFNGYGPKQAAVLVKKSAHSAYMFMHEPMVIARLAEIRQEYHALVKEEHRLEIKKAKAQAAISLEFVDEQLLDVIVNGQGKSKIRRVDAIEIALKRLGLIATGVNVNANANAAAGAQATSTYEVFRAGWKIEEQERMAVRAKAEFDAEPG